MSFHSTVLSLRNMWRSIKIDEFPCIFQENVAFFSSIGNFFGEIWRDPSRFTSLRSISREIFHFFPVETFLKKCVKIHQNSRAFIYFQGNICIFQVSRALILKNRWWSIRIPEFSCIFPEYFAIFHAARILFLKNMK